ncbi:unnamed protein product [Phytomonas sp. Hart1]|nr:unnamed protein product [Phytomonas sp. Hart1]|eukprot:CCW70902.1 unnamed protein product [Phytomonas sp. isolate Hart1]
MPSSFVPMMAMLPYGHYVTWQVPVEAPPPPPPLPHAAPVNPSPADATSAAASAGLGLALGILSPRGGAVGEEEKANAGGAQVHLHAANAPDGDGSHRAAA